MYLRTSITFLLCLTTILVSADDLLPTINPTAYYINSSGEEEEGVKFSGSAPMSLRFVANPKNADGWSAYYEWRFTKENEDEPYLIRYEQDTEYTFTQAGTHHVVLYATFTRGTETKEYKEEYWTENNPLIISISESKLEMPNAFSPNDDGINDFYQAKGTQQGNGPQSIISFEAHIFNRWGQKLYTWTDCYTYKAGWDGTYNGRPVADGVYYVLVKAKGADGRKYNFKKDVNLLRGYTEESNKN